MSKGLNRLPNAITSPGGILLGLLFEVNDSRLVQVKRDGKTEFIEVEYLKKQLDKPISGDN